MTRHPVIDLHSHWLAPDPRRQLAARPAAPHIVETATGPALVSALAPLQLGPQWSDVDHRLAHLDRHGVVHQLLSWPTTLNLEPALRLAEAKTFWRSVNDGFGGLVHRYPRRFSALAVLSTEDVDWSVAELRRAHDELGLIGFVLPVNSVASVAGVRHLAPLFAEAQRLRAHVYLHTGCGSAVVPGQPSQVEWPDHPGLGWTLAAMHHFGSAFATIACTDALDAYPDVTVQVAMLGGAGAAALLLEQVQLSPARFGAAIPVERIKRLVFDTGALGQGPAAIGAAVQVLGSDRIVFGSDYAPGADIGAVLANVADATISAEQLEAIRFGNARTLLARHGVDINPTASTEVDRVRV